MNTPQDRVQIVWAEAQRLTRYGHHVQDAPRRGLPGTRLPGPIRAQCMLTGVAASSVDLVVENDTAQLEAAGVLPAHLRFCCDTETFALLLYGRLRLEAAIASGRVVDESDPGLVTILDQWFKGV